MRVGDALIEGASGSDAHVPNGGFPEPPAGEPVRVVTAAHASCGTETRIRIPSALPDRAVRRVVCGACATPFTRGETALAAAPPHAPVAPAAQTETGPGPADPAPRRSGSGALSDPNSRLWRLLTVPLAALAVVGALELIQGEEPLPRATTTVGDAPAAEAILGAGSAVGEEAPAGAGESPAVPSPASPTGSGGEAQVVAQPGFTLALPARWQASVPPAGAAFAATAQAGGGEATLWIERNPELSFEEFEARSVEQLTSLAGGVTVAERIPAPTPEGSLVRLHAEAGEAIYDVTLRVAGPYLYYLTTTLAPDASRSARDGADLIHKGFIPEPASSGGEVVTGTAPGAKDAG